MLSSHFLRYHEKTFQSGVAPCLKKICQLSILESFSALEDNAVLSITHVQRIKELYKQEANYRNFPIQNLLVSIDEGRVFANNVEIIKSDAKLLFAIYDILHGVYRSCYSQKETTFIKAGKIADLLRERGFDIYDVKSQVRRNIQKIQRIVRKMFGVDIIISSKWKGYAIKENVIIKKGE